MKKLLLMILPAFICAGSLFAQTSTVSGVWAVSYTHLTLPTKA